MREQRQRRGVRQKQRELFGDGRKETQAYNTSPKKTTGGKLEASAGWRACLTDLQGVTIYQRLGFRRREDRLPSRTSRAQLIKWSPRAFSKRLSERRTNLPRGKLFAFSFQWAPTAELRGSLLAYKSEIRRIPATEISRKSRPGYGSCHLPLCSCRGQQEANSYGSR